MESTVFCQGCLATKHLVLFSKTEMTQKFENCFNLKVGFETSQLQWICKDCIQHLDDAVEFRTLVENTQKFLGENYTAWDKKIDTDIKVKAEDVKNENSEIDTEKVLLDVDLKFESDADFKWECDSDEDYEEKGNKKSKTATKPQKAKLRKKTTKPKKRKPKKVETTKSPEIVKKRNIICKICSQEFANECSLSVHKVNVHVIRANVPEFAAMLVCSYCNMAFTDLDEYHQHLIGLHEANKHRVTWETRNYVPCTICGFYFRDYSVRSYHVRTTHKLKDIPRDMLEKCSECEEMSENYLQQVTHAYNQHKKDLSVPVGCLLLSCEKCDLKFSKGAVHTNHMNLFHGGMPVSRMRSRCQFCRLFFKSKTDLDEHTLVHADVKKKKKKLPELRYKCPECLIYFKYKSVRKRHLEEAHNIRDVHPCEFCGAELASYSGLKKHRMIHTKEIIAICDYCGYGSCDKATLREHLTKHYDYKPFLCQVCHKSFKTRHNLTQHSRIHYEKKYSCQLCGVRFTHKSNIKSHMARNHKHQYLTEKSQMESL